MSVVCSCSCVLAMAGRLRSGPAVRAGTLGMCHAARIGRERVRGAVRAIALCRVGWCPAGAVSCVFGMIPVHRLSVELRCYLELFGHASIPYYGTG